MKPRTCPHCREVIPIDRDFNFDKKLNMICGICGKVVVSTSWEKESVPNYKTAQSLPDVPPYRSQDVPPYNIVPK